MNTKIIILAVIATMAITPLVMATDGGDVGVIVAGDINIPGTIVVGDGTFVGKYYGPNGRAAAGADLSLSAKNPEGVKSVSGKLDGASSAVVFRPVDPIATGTGRVEGLATGQDGSGYFKSVGNYGTHGPNAAAGCMSLSGDATVVEKPNEIAVDAHGRGLVHSSAF